MAIIAVLAAILLPVLLRGRELSVRAKCANNMRQLGHAFLMYVDDWSGCWPGPGGLRGDFNYWSQSGTGGLIPYVSSKGGIGSVWACPNMTEWSGPYPPRSYGMNSYIRNPPDAAYPGSISILRGMPDQLFESHRRTILLFEGIPILPAYMSELYYIYRCGDWTCVRGWYQRSMPRVHTIGSWQPWHGNKNNYLYCDGHLVSRTPAKYKNSQLASWDEMSEWYVQKSVMAKKLAPWK